MTVRLDEILDVANLNHMVAKGYVNRREGPDGCVLYNYTPSAQYERVWNRETLLCRGLVERDGMAQSRPFSKFFNIGEHDHDSLPAGPFEVFEKLDGSLIVVSTLPDGRPLVTTRGSFQSEQAVAALPLVAAGPLPPPDETWLFEFLAPWNRIVVDYGTDTRLVLLAVIDNATGLDLPLSEAWTGQRVRSFDGIGDFLLLKSRLAELGPNEEGYVLRFASGLRVKAKGDEYVRLHRLITGVNERRIWECLRDGRGVSELLERVPDEFYTWVTAVTERLNGEYAAVEEECREAHRLTTKLETRKEQALALADSPYRSVVFRMLDGRGYADLIWRGLQPAAERPFRVDADA